MTLTSSSIHQQIIDADPFIVSDHERRANFKRILQYTGQMSFLPDEEDQTKMINVDDAEVSKNDDSSVTIPDLMVLQVINPHRYPIEEEGVVEDVEE